MTKIDDYRYEAIKPLEEIKNRFGITRAYGSNRPNEGQVLRHLHSYGLMDEAVAEGFVSVEDLNPYREEQRAYFASVLAHDAQRRDAREHFSNADAIEVYGPSAQEIEERKAASATRRQKALEAAEAYIISKATIKPEYVSEDGTEPTTVDLLTLAINWATAEQLESFIMTGCVPFEGGYIKIGGAL